MNLVVDASVVGKCLVSEQDSDSARALFQEWAEGRTALLAPSILPAEVGNMLWKRARRWLIRADGAIRLFSEFQKLRIPLVRVERLAEPAFKLAIAHGHSVYDGLYVALAIQTGWDFVTADERLYNLLRPGFPQIRLLRDWR